MIGKIIDIQTRGDEQESFIEITLSKENGILSTIQDRAFKPYFYLIIRKNDLTSLENDLHKYMIINAKIDNAKKDNLQIQKFVNTNLTDIDFENDNYDLVKVEFDSIKNLLECRQKITEEKYFAGKLEYDIPYDIRYIVDKQIKPMHIYEIDSEFNFKLIKESFDYKTLSLDIETYPDFDKDVLSNPIILISLYSPECKIKKVIGYKKPENKIEYFTFVENEKELILETIKTIKENNFDLQIIKKRAKALGISKDLEDVLEYRVQTTAGNSICYTKGIQHIDAYKMVNHLNNIGAIDLDKLNLNNVYQYLFNKSKIDLQYKDMLEHYQDSKLLGKFIEYNLVDSIAAYEITHNFLPQYIKLSQITGLTIQDVIRAGSSTLVEMILMNESQRTNKIIPSKPYEDKVKAREFTTYEGGFVLEPKLGLHNNIAVLDFQSFHPSIIIAFNISPETYNINCDKYNVSPDGDKFCSTYDATIPRMLKEILTKRIKIKDKIKKIDVNSLEYKTLYAEQWSLKILLNSTYGYLGYARSRWYSLESARSILKYTHKYIHYVIDYAKENNLETIYSDTDSAFILYTEKEDVEEFLDKVNKRLPEDIHLALDNYYKRGLFISKKQGKSVAKKKYALIDFKDKLKITGFEFVRRDWSNIARSLQKDVLQKILKDNDTKGALDLVHKTISELRDRNVNKKDLIITNRIRKDMKDYSSIGPHVAAAIKAKEKGYTFEPDDDIDYIITNNGKTISEKAQIYQIAKDMDYDINYYIDNQVVPAVENIFLALGFDVSDLYSMPKQRKLF